MVLLSFAGPIQISFFQDGQVVDETLHLLKKNGCSEEAQKVFRGFIRKYYGEPFAVDLKKFPKRDSGFYHFKSAEELVTAVNEPFFKTEHSYEMNCFDTVIALTDGQMKSKGNPDEILGPNLYSKPHTNGLATTVAATPNDVFDNIYPDYYRMASDEMMPKVWHKNRICLTAALFADHVLPESTTENELAENVLKTLRANWNRHGVKFPEKWQVVMVHQIRLSRKFIGTTHIGLIIPRGKEFMLIEKDGGCGPFVRLDFKEMKDLLVWLPQGYKNSPDDHSHLFATFNDTKIEPLELSK